MSDKKPTLHHLNNSQSQRILWLLEELQIPYNLELHSRIPSGPNIHRAPPELTTTHPLGKSPQLITSTGRTITESSAIAAYLIKTYDTKWQFVGNSNTGNDDIRDEMLTSLANTSLAPLVQTELSWDVIVGQSPWPISYLTGYMRSMIQSRYSRPEMGKILKYLDDQLEGQEYFMGERPGRADFMVTWPLDMAVQRGYVKLEEYPKVKAWFERCKEREAWKRGTEKGGGYDLTIF